MNVAHCLIHAIVFYQPCDLLREEIDRMIALTKRWLDNDNNADHPMRSHVIEAHNLAVLWVDSFKCHNREWLNRAQAWELRTKAVLKPLYQ